jgi:hypothetical protein
MMTIPACEKCNGAKGQVDNTLRDYLVGDLDSSQPPVSEQIFQAKMETAIKENHVRLLDNFYAGRSIPAFTREGNFDTFVYAIPIDDQPLLEAVAWLTRGLHWQVFGESVTAADTTVKLVDRYKREDIVVQLAVLGFAGHIVQGDPFTCGWIVGEQGSVFWVHSFFDSVVFLAGTRLSADALEAHSKAARPRESTQVRLQHKRPPRLQHLQYKG